MEGTCKGNSAEENLIENTWNLKDHLLGVIVHPCKCDTLLEGTYSPGRYFGWRSTVTGPFA